MIGQLVDEKYEIVQLIGEGGMGAVYEAKTKGDGRVVAIKLINDEEVAQDEVLVARFEREARGAAKIKSPHIVEIIAAGHDEKAGNPFVLIANTSRGVMKVDATGLLEAAAMTERVGGPAGVTYETVESMQGVRQLADLGGGRVLVLLERDGALSLKAVDLP